METKEIANESKGTNTKKRRKRYKAKVDSLVCKRMGGIG